MHTIYIYIQVKNNTSNTIRFNFNSPDVGAWDMTSNCPQNSPCSLTAGNYYAYGGMIYTTSMASNLNVTLNIINGPSCTINCIPSAPSLVGSLRCKNYTVSGPGCSNFTLQPKASLNNNDMVPIWYNGSGGQATLSQKPRAKNP
jgi:hypothetical protein